MSNRVALMGTSGTDVATAPVSAARREAVDRARQSWIRKLIDLSRRNNLLYYRPLKTGTLDLTSAESSGMATLLSGVEPVSIEWIASDGQLRTDSEIMAEMISGSDSAGVGRGSKLRLRARSRLTELSNRRRQHRHCCSGVFCPRHASPGVRGTTRRVEGSYKLQNHRVIIDDFGWLPRRDLYPCYRRESGMAKRNSNKLQEHGPDCVL
jgi:hypothetical protein